MIDYNKIFMELDHKEQLAEEFSVKIDSLEKFLREKKKEFRISDQIYRSGTSIGAHIAETKFAESTNDYIHKLAGAQKEGNETLYWLRILYRTHYIDHELFSALYEEGEVIMRILSKIIKTLKDKDKK